jgi:hypothetical protein
MKPSAEEAGFCEPQEKCASKPVGSGVKCIGKASYDDGPRKLFRPGRQQIRNARGWLVRVIARRAVDKLKAQETGP